MMNIQRNGMNAVKINRLKLLGIVQANMATHIKDFNESVIDYKDSVLKIAKENLALAETGDLEKIAKIVGLLAKPVSYESSYKRATRMLELSVDDEIDVEEDVFNQLVLDEWTWKHSFSTSNTMYKTISSSRP